MKKLLILGAHFDYQKGGAEYQYKILEDYLKDKYATYYLFRHPEPLNRKNFLNYDYRFRKRYNPNLYTDAAVIYRLIKKISPDIIYKRGVNYIAAVGVCYAKMNKIRMVLHVSSQRNVEKTTSNRGILSILDFLNQSIGKYAINHADRIVCQTKYQSGLLQKNFGRCCDLILPNVHPLPDRAIEKTLPQKVVWISNLKKLKQPELFIDLAEHFRSNRNARFIMIGRPALGSWQNKILKKISRTPNLEYKGELPIEQVNAVLQKSHILVNTSEYEGFPNTYIQAWMRKVPVVALNSDPDDLLKTKGIGFHSKTFRQMVLDVKSLIENGSLREKMGEKSCEFACNRFAGSQIDDFVNLIDEV